MLIALNKPFQVLSQFSPVEGKRTLAELVPIPEVYPAGRLDYDSEGLLLLTDDGKLQQRISAPATKFVKRYWVQVEGVIDTAALSRLARGVVIEGVTTLQARARAINQPDLWPREPPIRERRAIPTSWLEIAISEGRNRQVRRMTAAVGFPTLRLVRVGIGDIDLLQLGLATGAWCEIDGAISRI